MRRQTHPRIRNSLVRSLLGVLALACSAACAHEPTEPPASGATPAATAAEPNPAAAGVVDRRGKAGASVFVAHRVSDFEAFKKFFEEGAAEREKVGVKGHLLTRLEERRVAIHLFASDLDALKLTLDSPFLKEFADRSGAPDASLVWVAYDELVKLPTNPATGQTFSLYLKLSAADLTALRRGFVELQPLFAEHGVIASGLHHGVDQSDLVVAHFVGTARDKLDALAKHPRFLEWLKSGGTAGTPQTFLGDDVSRSRTYYDGF